MDNLLEIIENDYGKFCIFEYIFSLNNGIKVNLKFKEENLPHLIGLHKLKAYYPVIRQMEDENDITITPKNIFKILKHENISYNTLKNGIGWNVSLQNRMENFIYSKIDSILRKTTMFNFIFDKEKTKNDKAKYVLIDKPSDLFLQLYIGYDDKIKSYYPNSFVANSIKDNNLEREAIKIIKTEIYKISISGKSIIETIEHEKIREMSNEIQQILKLYKLKNNNLYELAKNEKSYEAELKEVNDLAKLIKKYYYELTVYVVPNIFLIEKSNNKLRKFLIEAGVVEI